MGHLHVSFDQCYIHESAVLYIRDYQKVCLSLSKHSVVLSLTYNVMYCRCSCPLLVALFSLKPLMHNKLSSDESRCIVKILTIPDKIDLSKQATEDSLPL